MEQILKDMKALVDNLDRDYQELKKKLISPRK